MLSLEEVKILKYLSSHLRATAAEVGRTCLAGASAEWVNRVVANLDWLGYVAALSGTGASTVVMITEKGLAYFGPRKRGGES